MENRSNEGKKEETKKTIFKLPFKSPENNEVYKEKMDGFLDPSLREFTPICMASVAQERSQKNVAEAEWVDSYIEASKELARLNQELNGGTSLGVKYVIREYYFTLPTLFLIRHAAELAIKEAIKKIGGNPKDEHDLTRLWNSFLSNLPKDKAPSDKDTIKEIGKNLDILSHLDRDGTRVRYSIDKHGKLTHGTFEWIDCGKLSESVSRLIEVLRNIDFEYSRQAKENENRAK